MSKGQNAFDMRQMAIQSIRERWPNVLDVHTLDDGHVEFFVLEHDPALEATLREGLPMGIILTFLTFDQFIQKGEALMSHFNGI